ncbi:Ada metal-binding domain-containing protein [Desulfosporosinus lacus]|uniref:Ada metal-binding domain-containing protein n=1 Tax=Desulfosporosinus lacus TaxID=329936 RepID=UPI0011614EBA|nr:Ada metal-binding domain-containing protein [Desulfosporosinus lacus]
MSRESLHITYISIALHRKKQYVKNRVFFADEKTAIAAGYRPCAKCMTKEYADWKAK